MLACLAALLLNPSRTLAATPGTATAGGGVIFSNECLVVTCPGDRTIFTCSDIVTPASYGVIVENRCPAIPTPTVTCTPPPGTPLGLGVHPIHCTVGFAGAVLADCDFVLTVVRDTEPPKIECPQSLVVLSCPDPATGACGAIVNYPAPIASDNSGAVSVVCNPPSGSFFPCGDTVVTCVAFDRCQNQSVCKFLVTVKEGGKPPTLKCPENIVAYACKETAVVTYPDPTVDPAGTTVICIPPSGSVFPLGTHPVLCIASNACGIARCEFLVTVKPMPPVSIQCPASITVTLPCGKDCLPVFYPSPIVMNGALESCNPPSGSCLTPGTHVVVCRATNECSVAACEFVITVVKAQGEPPIIRCPQDISLRTCKECQVVKYPDPVVVNGSLALCTPPSGSCFPIGVTTVVCIATNSCGLRAECSFNVVVRPVEKLQIKCPPDILVKSCSPCEVVTYPAPVVVGGALVSCTPPSGTCFPVGSTTVVCIATNECEKIECSFTVTVEPTQCVKPPANMVLWLPFDEPSGIVANNIISGAPNGWHMNGPVPVPGQKVLNSLRFDGVNDYVAVPNYAAIILSQSDITIDAWVFRRDTDGGRRVIVSKMRGLPGTPVARGYEFYLNNGIMNLLLGGPSLQNFNSGVGVPIDGNWHHVAVTVQRSGTGLVDFYLDGALAASQPGPIVAPIGSAAPLHVGAATWPAPQDFWRGAIDELEIFNRALTSAEIHSLWAADRAGKCKIKIYIPWDVAFPPGGGYVTVPAFVFNDTPIPQPMGWSASGPMPIPVSSGTFVIAPNSITNILVKLCRPTNDVPVGTVVEWEFMLVPDNACPIMGMGSVLHPGKASATVPPGVVPVPGTTRPVRVRTGVSGLLTGAPVRYRAIGPDMVPDQTMISLNGLPPGTPFLVPFAPAAPAGSPDEMVIEVPVQFVHPDPISPFTILLEADVDGDGAFDTLASFDVSNPVVPPPRLVIDGRADGNHLLWEDEGDGILLSSPSLDGPWTPIPGARPGYLLTPVEKQLFFEVEIPAGDSSLPAVQ